MHTLYTYGYTGGKITDLQRWARDGALILDVRYSPRSRNPVWTPSYLTRSLGDAYEHEKCLGNLNYRGDRGEGIQIVNLDAGLHRVQHELAKRPVVLLCACSDVESCHRKYISDAALRRDPQLRVEHLRSGQALGRAPELAQGSLF